MQRWLLLVFLTTIAIDWPQLPFNMRATDAAFIAAAVAILAGSRRWTRPRLHFLDVAILVYLAGSLSSLIFSVDPRSSAIELIRQIYLAAIYLVIALAAARGLAPTVATGVALAGGLLAGIGLMAAAVKLTIGIGSGALTPVMTLPYLGDTVRLRALTASEAMFACLLAVAIPFAMRHPAVASSRARTVAAAAIPGIAAALTFSHSIAGVAVAALVAGWSRWLSHRPLRVAAVAATLAVVAAFNFAASVSIRAIGTSPLRDDTVFHYAVDRGRAEIAGVNVEYQTMSYLRLKQVAWEAFTQRPLFGVGLDGFHAVTETAFQRGRLTAPYRTIDPHSTFPGRLAEAGIVGGLTLLVLWIAIVRAAAGLWRSAGPNEWMAIAATAAVAGTLVNSLNADVMNFRFLWVTLGLVRGLSALTPQTV